MTKSCYLFQPQALAVIDWEGACWGHPFEDLAYFCFPFHFPAALEFMPAGKIGKTSFLRFKDDFQIDVILVLKLLPTRSRFQILLASGVT